MNIAPLALLLLFFVACAMWWRERMRARLLLQDNAALRGALAEPGAGPAPAAVARAGAQMREAEWHEELADALLRVRRAAPEHPEAGRLASIEAQLRAGPPAG